MKKVDTVENETRAVGLVIALVFGLVCAATQGCAVPALLGVKSYQSGDTKIEFITGVDFGIGMNGIDQVQNSRGIAPVSETGAAVRKAAGKY